MHDSQHLTALENAAAAHRIAETAHLRIVSDPNVGYVHLTGDSTAALRAVLTLLDIDPEPTVSTAPDGKRIRGQSATSRPLARLTKTEARRVIDAGVPIAIEGSRRR